MAMEVLARTLFSGTEGIAAATEVKRSLPALLDGMGRRAYLPVNFVHRLPLPANRRFQQARARLNAVVDGIIADYRATGTDRGDLLSLLVLAVDEETGQGMSEQQLRDEVLTMLIGGTETTATTIAWVLHLVATYPEVEAAVHAEVDEVLAGQPASHEHLPRLDYCRRVVMETLRMYPIGWLLTRNALTDVDLGGHRIPAGADVFFSPWCLQRDPAIYPEPDRFDPDRWLPDRARKIPRHAYLPFSAGTRKCVGESFAVAESTLVLATLSARWRLRPDPDRPARPKAAMTYRLVESWMIVEPRDHASAPPSPSMVDTQLA
jgi:pentalenene oxygenase